MKRGIRRPSERGEAFTFEAVLTLFIDCFPVRFSGGKRAGLTRDLLILLEGFEVRCRFGTKFFVRLTAMGCLSLLFHGEVLQSELRRLFFCPV